MRVAVVVVLVCAGLVFAILGGRVGHGQVDAQNRVPQRPVPVDPKGQLIALTSDGDNHQQVTLVDPKTRVMSVYHVDRRSGEIVLKSVRNVHWDLQMEEFNGVSPSPREIRSLLQQR